MVEVHRCHSVPGALVLFVESHEKQRVQRVDLREAHPAPLVQWPALQATQHGRQRSAHHRARSSSAAHPTPASSRPPRAPASRTNCRRGETPPGADTEVRCLHAYRRRRAPGQPVAARRASRTQAVARRRLTLTCLEHSSGEGMPDASLGPGLAPARRAPPRALGARSTRVDTTFTRSSSSAWRGAGRSGLACRSGHAPRQRAVAWPRA
eukprot:scaffold1789_cov375-Prasinococcus_capsulatus_cf.AAC.9